MLKKFLLASAIVSVTSSIAVANPAPYIGAGLGIVTNTSSSVANSKVGTTILSQPGNFRGVPFNLFAGYGGVVSQTIYLAGEVFGTVGTGEISNSNELKTTYGYGASVIPGVLLSDHTLAFVRAGLVRTRFSSANSTRTGGQIGLGLQTCVTQNVDVRGEYDYTSYGSFNNSIGNVSSPRSDAFNLGLIYKFD
jgi:outer membrane immunogenic protein